MINSKLVDEIQYVFNGLITLHADSNCFEFIENYLSKYHSDDSFANFLKSNIDLIYEVDNEIGDVKAVVTQILLELSHEDPIRLAFLDQISETFSNSSYYHPPSSQFFNDRSVKVVQKHDDKVSSLCRLKNGCFVSADNSGKIIYWHSITPLSVTYLSGHNKCVQGIIETGDSFITWDKNKIIVWDTASQRIQSSTDFENEIKQIISANNGIIYILSTNFYFDVYDESVEHSFTYDVFVSAFAARKNSILWKKNIQIRSNVIIQLSPDKTILFVITGYKFIGICNRADSLRGLDAISGGDIESLNNLSDNSKLIYLSTHELPVFVHEFRNISFLLDCNGAKVQLSDKIAKSLDDAEVYLFQSPGIVLHNVYANLVTVVDFSDPSSSILFKGVKHILLHAGRYMVLYQSDKPEEFYLSTSHKRIVYDLITNETIISQRLTDESFNLTSFSMTDDFFAIIRDDTTLEILNIKERRFDIFRGLQEFFIHDSIPLISLDQKTYVWAGSNGALEFLFRNTNITREANILIFDSVESILGCRGKYFVTVNSIFQIIIYDTDSHSVFARLEGLTSVAMGVFWLPEGLLGAWTENDGVFIWDLTTGKVTFSFNFVDLFFYGARPLKDGSLLCWGGEREGPKWKKIKFFKVNTETKEQASIITLYDNRDEITGSFFAPPKMLYVGGCKELESGRLLIYPFSWSQKIFQCSFDMISVDPGNPKNIFSIPMIEKNAFTFLELPGNKLIVATGSFLEDPSDSVFLLYFDLEEGKLLSKSASIGQIISNIFRIDAHTIGALSFSGIVFKFKVDNLTMTQIGKIEFSELLLQQPENSLISTQRAEIGVDPVVFGIMQFRFEKIGNGYSSWYNDSSKIFVEVRGSSVLISDIHGTRYCVGRVPLHSAYAFKNSIVIVSSEKRVGFLTKEVYKK